MKLKNLIIQALYNNGIANTTNHDVPVKDAYKAFKFKDAVVKAAEEIENKRSGIAKEAGIEDGGKFDKRRKELMTVANPTEEQAKELAEMNEKFDKFQCLWKELMDDETELEGIKLMSFESYHALAKENRQTRLQVPTGDKKTATVFVDFYQMFMADLEGVIWKAPEEDE